MSEYKHIILETGEYRAFFQRLGKAAQGDFKKDLLKFLEGLGYEFLRIVQDEIVRKQVMDTRLLLTSFEKGQEDNVWVLDEGNFSLEVGTNVKYAKWVNDGHRSNPEGVETRFVPGHWDGDRFVYVKGAKEGMVLKMKWVPGAHYWESALHILEKMYPRLMEAKLQDWLNTYFSDFM